MAHTQCRTVYSFDELDESAKSRARDWYRELEAQEWDPESTLEDAAEICDILGIELSTHPVKLYGGGTRHDPTIHYSGFYSQGDGASFEGMYRYKAGAGKAIRQHAPVDAELHRIADELQRIQRAWFYRLVATVSPGRNNSSHEYSVDIDVQAWDSQDNAREVSTAASEAVTEALRDVMRWIYRQLEQEYEYRLADEQIDESIRANEYEFREDGTHDR